MNSVKNEFVRLETEMCDIEKHFSESEKESARVLGIGPDWMCIPRDKQHVFDTL